MDCPFCLFKMFRGVERATWLMGSCGRSQAWWHCDLAEHRQLTTLGGEARVCLCVLESCTS